MVRGTGGFRRQRRRVPFLSANFPIEKRSPANNVAAYPQIADVARPRRSGTRPRSKITVLRMAAFGAERTSAKLKGISRKKSSLQLATRTDFHRSRNPTSCSISISCRSKDDDELDTLEGALSGAWTRNAG